MQYSIDIIGMSVAIIWVRGHHRELSSLKSIRPVHIQNCYFEKSYEKTN